MGLRKDLTLRAWAEMVGLVFDPKKEMIGVAGQAMGPLAGARFQIQTSEQADRQATPARLIASGVVRAFAWKNGQSDGHWFLTIEHAEFAAVVEVGAASLAQARKLVDALNARALELAPYPPSTAASTGTEPEDARPEAL